MVAHCGSENGETMALRMLRVGVGVLLVASGALLYAGSWQRWARACPWGDGDGAQCTERQDNLYDFVAPSAPWEPVGDAAQLAGWSLVVLALAFVLLPWALTGRRPGVFSAVALVFAVLATAAVGIATLRSGLTGSVVQPTPSDLAGLVWVLVPPALLVRFAIDSRGWTLASAAWLVLATPFVAMFSYAVGPYDARPWYEGIWGLLTATGGLCLLGAAAFTGRSSTHESAATGASPANGPAFLI
jgi:hypothetical protein